MAGEVDAGYSGAAWSGAVLSQRRSSTTRFVLRRLAIIPPALLLVNFLGYAYANLAGPIRAARIPYLRWTPNSEPLIPAYKAYLQGLLRFDLGTMPGGSEETIATVLSRAGLASLGLLALALTLSILIGLTLGLRAVRAEPRGVSRWLTILSTAGLAMPSFYVGSLLILTSLSFVLWRGPGSEAPLPIRGFGWDLHLVLPTLALMVRPTVQIAQVTADLLVDELGKRYIVTARSVGLLWRVICQRHALRNILAPVILAIVGSFRLLTGELILVEWLFGWPGLGRLLALALIPGQLSVSAGSPLFLNPPVVAAVLTCFATLFLVTDLISAILVWIADPRLRAPEEGTGSADVVSSQSKSARRNWHLLLGCLIVLLIIVIAIAGPALAPQDPLEDHTIVRVGDGWETPPFPALVVPGFPLGSDEFGRDLLSRLLWAVRPTMALIAIVALVRLVLGTLIGLVSGWSTGRVSHALDAGIAGALSLPVLMVALGAIAAVGIEIGLLAFLIGLSVTGWAETARIVRERTRLVKGQHYIEAARALGQSDFQILFRHVLPQVMPMVWMLLALEVSGTLMATAGLGFLGYYIGGDVWVEVEDFVSRRLSGMPELGQMLAASSTFLEVLTNPWTMIVIGTLIFVAVLGFNLLGEGLRQRLRVELMGRRTILSRVTRRVGPWIEERALLPLAGWARRHSIPTATVGVLILIVTGGLVWWRVQAAKQPEEPAIVLEVPGEHLWATGRHDPWGTLWSEATGPTNPEVRQIFEDPTGFSGGPAVAADGTVYAASNGGTLYALDPDGHILWQETLSAGAVGPPALSAEEGIYVAGEDGNLSAFTPDGAPRWRFQPEGRCIALAGPVAAPDGTIYYPVGFRDPPGTSVQAVSPDGALLWEAPDASFEYRVSPPWLSPTGELLFWKDLVLDTRDGAQRELETPVDADQYIMGADGRTYFLSEHTIVEWRPAEPGAEIVESVTWDYRRMGAPVPPEDGGVTRGRVIWLLYNYPTQIAWLDISGRVLGTFRCPFRWGRVMAVDQESTVYVCGVQGSREVPRSRCLALNDESEDPIWEVSFDGKFVGSALVPERLYIATGEGLLYALGSGEGGTSDAMAATAAANVTPPPAPTPTSLSTGQVTHVVRPDENLFRIALRCGKTVEAIASTNGIANPDRIYVGQAPPYRWSRHLNLLRFVRVYKIGTLS